MSGGTKSGGGSGFGQSNQRRHARFELYASVEIRRGEERLVLSVQNISVAGVLLLADGHDLSSLAVGALHELVVFDRNDQATQVKLVARVARRPPEGVAFTWSDEDAMFEIAALLGKLKKR